MLDWIRPAVLVCLWPALGWAAPPEDAQPPQNKAKPQTVAAPKAQAKPKDKTQAKAKAPAKPVYVYTRAKPPVPVPVPAHEHPLEPDASVVAETVHTGRMVCELGNSVHVSADPQNPGHFHVQMNKHNYHMVRVVSATGAIRLEDARAGAMWLQLSNKSMLMNSKLGQRMADECQSPGQMEVADAMRLAPPVSLLEGLNTGPSLAKK